MSTILVLSPSHSDFGREVKEQVKQRVHDAKLKNVNSHTCLNVKRGLSMVLGDSREEVEDRDSKASEDPSVSCDCPFI